jgi:hypothetical protein
MFVRSQPGQDAANILNPLWLEFQKQIVVSAKNGN